MTRILYVLGDADRVREGIDQRLLRGELENLREFSRALTEAVAKLLRAFETDMGADILMAGGDDVLFRVHASRYSLSKNREFAIRFHEETGCRISFGVSATLSGAYINLRRAKAEKIGICSDDVLI